MGRGGKTPTGRDLEASISYRVFVNRKGTDGICFRSRNRSLSQHEEQLPILGIVVLVVALLSPWKAQPLIVFSSVDALKFPTLL